MKEATPGGNECVRHSVMTQCRTAVTIRSTLICFLIRFIKRNEFDYVLNGKKHVARKSSQLYLYYTDSQQKLYLMTLTELLPERQRSPASNTAGQQ